MKKEACPYCGSEKQKLFMTTKDWNWDTSGVFCLVRCEICSLVFLSPAPDVDELKTYYPKNYYTRASGLVELTEEMFRSLERGYSYRLKFIRKFQNPGRVLDVGCGDGHFLNFLKVRRWDTWGVEMSEMACGYAVEKLGLEKDKIVCSDFMAVNLPEKYFDLVTINDVLEHLSEPVKILERCFQLLKLGGGIYIQVPNFNSLGRRIFGSHWIHIDAPRHQIHFTSKTLNRFLKDWKIMGETTRTNFGQAYVSGYSDSFRYWLVGRGLYSYQKKSEEKLHSKESNAKFGFSMKKAHVFAERFFFKFLGVLSDMCRQGEILQVYARRRL